MDATRYTPRPRPGQGRRLATPVRVTLASLLGGEVDGGWWPHTGSVARELPELIGALHEPLGTVTDISVNWRPIDGQPDLHSVQFGGASAVPGRDHRPQHLMTLTGRRDRAILLVVPHLTRADLAMMLLRLAAGIPVPAGQQAAKAFESAALIVRAARAESALRSAVEQCSAAVDPADTVRTAEAVSDV